jgi:endonuclease/exonuclease/phosphatase family metal-dependent hydrolase
MRLVTLNSWKCDGAYVRRLTRMADGLAELAPDLVALQEVFICPALGCDTAAFLAEALAMSLAVLPLRRKERRVEGRLADSWSGLAILSRLPILSQRAVALPSDPRDGERAALIVDLDDGGRRIALAALHLTHLRDAGALRRRQWSRIVAELADVPIALAAGDFNCGADMFATDGRFGECRRHLGLDPQPTLIGGGPADCIDHIVFSGDGALVPVACRTAMTEAIGGLTASDHCAVCADFDRAI